MYWNFAQSRQEKSDFQSRWMETNKFGMRYFRSQNQHTLYLLSGIHMYFLDKSILLINLVTQLENLCPLSKPHNFHLYNQFHRCNIWNMWHPGSRWVYSRIVIWVQNVHMTHFMNTLSLSQTSKIYGSHKIWIFARNQLMSCKYGRFLSWMK